MAAQITSGRRPAELYAAILAEGHQARAGTAGSDGRRAPALSGPTYMEWSNTIIDSAEDASDMRRRIGAAALEMDASDGSSQTRWHDIVAARLPSHHWPQQRVLIPAVDAHTGEPVVFDRRSGISLVDAVAASTSAMTPYRIGDHRYLNGGYRRSSNTDLAADTGGYWCWNHSAAGRGRRWSGAWISQARSTNFAQGAARSRRSSRMPVRATCSMPTRWIHRRVRRPREEATTKAEPLPSTSPTSGADTWMRRRDRRGGGGDMSVGGRSVTARARGSARPSAILTA